MTDQQKTKRQLMNLKKTKEDLLEAHKRLDQILDYLPDATLVIDAQGKVIAWNKAIEQMTGVGASDMLGKGNYEYALPFYGERRPILIDLVLQHSEEMEVKYTSVERKDTVMHGEAYVPVLKGGEVYLSVTAGILRDSKGSIAGAIESIRDITDRKKAEDKYKGIFDNAVMGIFQVTPEGKIISVNPAFARILGYDSPEDVLETITDIGRQIYVSHQDYKTLSIQIHKFGTVQGAEVELLRKDGHSVWVDVSGCSVCDGSGKTRYYEGTIQDVTKRRHLEYLLRQAQKMEAIGSLAGGIAHDFNNILASMIGFTEMANKETRENIRRKYHDRVLQSCDRAKHLVSQILSFSRQKEQEKYPVDIRFIIQEALTLLRATLPSTIEIRQEITDEQTTVLADPTQIHQIMMNLCTNAAYAMKEKGGFIDIHLSNLQITHSSMPPHPDLQIGSYIQLSIRDTGQGIDSTIQDKIFDPFFTTKKPNEGTGLGLSVVYGIVKSCGGAVDVQSSLGKGATFVIYLPSIHREAYQETTEEEDLDPRGNERILFIDDEESLVVLAQAFFQSKGYQITSTVSSIEALTLFQRTPEAFDLVITDMTMPEMTGADLARSFLTIRPNLPIILCTGYSDAIHLEKARKLNIRELVAKPVSMRDLGILVRRLLNR
jgi:PAS domain S-box-containing protein